MLLRIGVVFASLPDWNMVRLGFASASAFMRFKLRN